jgi:hypothetical protein
MDVEEDDEQEEIQIFFIRCNGTDKMIRMMYELQAPEYS